MTTELNFTNNKKNYTFSYSSRLREEGKGREKKEWIDYFVTFHTDDPESHIDEVLLFSENLTDGVTESNAATISTVDFDLLSLIESHIQHHEQSEE